VSNSITSRFEIFVEAIIKCVKGSHITLLRPLHFAFLVQDPEDNEGEEQAAKVEEVAKDHSELVAGREISVRTPVCTDFEKVIILCINQTSDEQIEVCLKEE
jgi:hypothetical protein